jgi:hypothetical protein
MTRKNNTWRTSISSYSTKKKNTEGNKNTTQISGLVKEFNIFWIINFWGLSKVFLPCIKFNSFLGPKK